MHTPQHSEKFWKKFYSLLCFGLPKNDIMGVQRATFVGTKNPMVLDRVITHAIDE